ncbi:hypothetical protein B0H13DRAFT_2671918 [Mycena leptocephala]|nr:hypothetical protein B0H13DRAFT_2671918 [Mycena leptocephala]
MSAAATFCNRPLSTSFSSELEKSALSLDWVLASGINASASVTSGVLAFPLISFWVGIGFISVGNLFLALGLCCHMECLISALLHIRASPLLPLIPLRWKSTAILILRHHTLLLLPVAAQALMPVAVLPLLMLHTLMCQKYPPHLSISFGISSLHIITPAHVSLYSF